MRIYVGSAENTGLENAGPRGRRLSVMAIVPLVLLQGTFIVLLWPSYGIGQAIIFSPCSLFFFFFLFFLA